MKKTDSIAMLSLLDKLIEAMTEYERKTDGMITGDLQIIQNVLMDRNDVIERMKSIKGEIIALIGVQNLQDKTLLKAMLNDKQVPEHMSSDQRQMQMKMKQLHNIKLSIENKDRKITTYVQQRFEDVKAELASLQKDKKKIDYYNSVGKNGKGRSFDSKL